MNKPIKQHTVPKCYLKGFTNIKGDLIIYLRHNKKYLELKPENINIISDFYTLKNNGEKDYIIEDFFSKYIEAPLPKILTKINSLQVLGNEEKDTLAIFITFQYLRTETLKNTINKLGNDLMRINHQLLCLDEANLDFIIDQFNKENPEKITKEEFKKIFDHCGDIVDISNNLFAQNMLGLFEEIFPIIRYLDWMFMVAPDETHFITSDNPFSTMSAGLLKDGNILLFPICNQICLNFSKANKPNDIGHQMQYIKLKNKEEVKSFNDIIALNSYKGIIGESLELIENIVNSNNLGEIPPKELLIKLSK